MKEAGGGVDKGSLYSQKWNNETMSILGQIANPRNYNSGHLLIK
jgi:hypothetical protein